MLSMLLLSIFLLISAFAYLEYNIDMQNIEKIRIKYKNDDTMLMIMENRYWRNK